MTDTTQSPTTYDHDDVLERAAEWRAQGKDVAIATVVSTWGSSPRPVGSQLAVDGDSNMIGSVSGGCIEGAVIHDAKEVMADGKPRLLEFGVADEMAWEVGLACGGRIEVYVERLD
ncbi:MAG: XdhC family protein [Alphaproteobacteria bacterium]|nr:XdhC family protein [Alphaproteobacteria bacterium]